MSAGETTPTTDSAVTEDDTGIDLDAVVDDRPDAMTAPPLAELTTSTFGEAARTPQRDHAGDLLRIDTPVLLAELVRRARIGGDPRLGLAFRLVAEACGVDAAGLRDAVERASLGEDGPRS